MSKAHVRRRKGFCGGRRDEAVRGNAVSADTQVSRASLCLLLPCACPLLPCLITLHVRYYRYCQGGLTWLHCWHARSQVLTRCPGDCAVLFWCAVEGLCAEASGQRSRQGSRVLFVIGNCWKVSVYAWVGISKYVHIPACLCTQLSHQDIAPWRWPGPKSRRSARVSNRKSQVVLGFRRHVMLPMHSSCLMQKCLSGACVLTRARRVFSTVLAKWYTRAGSGRILHTPDWPGSSWQLSVPWPAANFSISFLLA